MRYKSRQWINMEFKITDEYIELYKLIKAADLVDSGAEAKQLIAEGYVMRNGEEETRKRAKIKPNEVITIGEVNLKVIS